MRSNSENTTVVLGKSLTEELQLHFRAEEHVLHEPELLFYQANNPLFRYNSFILYPM